MYFSKLSASLLSGRLYVVAKGVFLTSLLLCWVVLPECLLAAKLPMVAPADVGLDAERLKPLDALIERHIAAGEMPGCVLAVGRHGKLALLKAYGNRQEQPDQERMTTDTIFDLASLTKPVATATSIMVLVERGDIRLHDRVANIFPEFAANGKSDITILQLLTHTSGLIADNPLSDYQHGPDKAWEKICQLSLVAEPNRKFIYSDVNFIVLGKIVEKVSGTPLDRFAQQHIFGPLAMADTGFCPPVEKHVRVAPTEKQDGRWLRGTVHDPRAAALGGVAGHAGLFSTAEDLATYAHMLLQGGSWGQARILSPYAVAVMTADYFVPGGIRGLGWDKRSAYSSNRAELYTRAAFGHGGFTGTAMWIDPELDLFVIFLSSRLHPDGKGLVNPLIARIGNVVVGAITEPSGQSTARFAYHTLRPTVQPGIDVLREDNYRLLEGQRVGLITNPTGVSSDGVSTVELLHRARNVNLVALFSPEHGWEAKLDTARIGHTTDPKTGLPVYSLYGETRKPTPEMLHNIDTLVFDIQDVGCRFYTYVSTMGLAMEAATEQGKRFVVLDRPNPINGVDVSGPVLDRGRESFVGFHTTAVRHAMTVGELAKMICAERGWQLDLTVVAMRGWNRRDYFDETGLPWINPSPNMRSVTAALLYPGIGLLETTNVSVGRGTDTPFEVLGAPWIEPVGWARALNAMPETVVRGKTVVRFVPIWFAPASSTYAGEQCGGVRILVLDRQLLDPVRLGFAIARQLRLHYADHWKVDGMDRLLANATALELLRSAAPTDDIANATSTEFRQFLERRRRFLIYP